MLCGGQSGWEVLRFSTPLTSCTTKRRPFYITLCRVGTAFDLALQRSSLDGVRPLVKTEAEVNKAVKERFVTVDHAVRLMISQSFCQLHALLSRNSLHTLLDDKLLDRNATKKLQFTAPDLFSVSDLLCDKDFQPLQIIAPARERAKMIEPGDQRSELSRPTTAASVEHCQEEQRLLM